MITVYFFIVLFYGDGRAAIQAGPFESAQQCEAARAIVARPNAHYIETTKCYAGVLRTEGK